jgi:hypothetical protein
MKKTSKQEGKGRPRAKPAAQTKLANGALLHFADAAEGGVQAELTLRSPVIAGA